MGLSLEECFEEVREDISSFLDIIFTIYVNNRSVEAVRSVHHPLFDDWFSLFQVLISLCTFRGETWNFCQLISPKTYQRIQRSSQLLHLLWPTR